MQGGKFLTKRITEHVTTPNFLKKKRLEPLTGKKISRDRKRKSRRCEREKNFCTNHHSWPKKVIDDPICKSWVETFSKIQKITFSCPFLVCFWRPKNFDLLRLIGWDFVLITETDKKHLGNNWKKTPQTKTKVSQLIF